MQTHTQTQFNCFGMLLVVDFYLNRCPFFYDFIGWIILCQWFDWKKQSNACKRWFFFVSFLNEWTRANKHGLKFVWKIKYFAFRIKEGLKICVQCTQKKWEIFVWAAVIEKKIPDRNRMSEWSFNSSVKKAYLNAIIQEAVYWIIMEFGVDVKWSRSTQLLALIVIIAFSKR